MAKYTLLKMTQKVLDSLDSDQVNSITDTVESAAVANLIEDVFYNLITNEDIPEHQGILRMTALADSDRPAYLKMPTSVSRITSVRYNVSTTGALEYREIDYVNPETFIMRMVGLVSTESNVTTMIDPVSTATVLVLNDQQPNYWTSFDDEYMLFNSYDSDIDSTLSSSKSLVLGRTLPTFTQSDTFTPDIDDNLFPLLLNEAKSMAFIELKQTAHPKAEQWAKRQKSAYQNERSRTDQANIQTTDFGRKRP